MPNSHAPIVRTLSNRTSLSLTRTSLFKLMALLAGVFAAVVYSLVYLAYDMDRTEQAKSAFHARKAMQSLDKSLRLTVKDYAFWNDAYKHLHVQVDTDWAYVRENVGPTLFQDFGFQGLFVVNDVNRTVYAVVEGKLQPLELSSWLGQSIDPIIEQARAGAASETPVTSFINVRGSPALVAAAAIIPGTDPTVLPDGRRPSVLIFVDILDSAKLDAIGDDFGVANLHIASSEEIGKSLLPLGDNGAAGSLYWEPERPGLKLVGVGLPLLGLAALLVCAMTWMILRRSTASALALDASNASLQSSQAALATSEARFRDVVEASSDWVWEIDATWHFTYLSERFESVTGLARQAWMGAAMNDLLDTDVGHLSQWLATPGRRPDLSVHAATSMPKVRRVAPGSRPGKCLVAGFAARPPMSPMKSRRDAESSTCPSTTLSPGCPTVHVCKLSSTASSRPRRLWRSRWSCSPWTLIASSKSTTCSAMPLATACSMSCPTVSSTACAMATW